MKDVNDVVILGSGPAGLQAAIHAARRRVSVLVVGKVRKSGIYSAHIDNFCCLDGKTGGDLLRQARSMAENAGAKFLDEDVMKIAKHGGHYIITTETDKKLKAVAIIMAMGVERNTLELPNEESLIGRGVSYCVDCDGAFFAGEKVAMVGCESAAVSGALTLLFYASEVHLICSSFDASDYLLQRLKESSIHVHEGRKVTEIVGEESVSGLVLDDGTKIDVKGVFIEMGAVGAIELAADLGVDIDPETMKYLVTNRKQETNIAGIYAAGDICGPPWQVAKAIGEGCVAGLEAAAYAKKNK